MSVFVLRPARRFSLPGTRVLVSDGKVNSGKVTRDLYTRANSSQLMQVPRLPITNSWAQTESSAGKGEQVDMAYQTAYFCRSAMLFAACVQTAVAKVAPVGDGSLLDTVVLRNRVGDAVNQRRGK